MQLRFWLIRIQIKTYAVSHYCIGVWYGLMVWLIQQQSSSDAKQNRPKINSLPFLFPYLWIHNILILHFVKLSFYIFTVIINYALSNYNLIILNAFGLICDDNGELSITIFIKYCKIGQHGLWQCLKIGLMKWTYQIHQSLSNSWFR